MVIHSGPLGAREVVVLCTTPGKLSIAMVSHTNLAKPGI
jgi:hypothetical protein